ncbi:MAG: hypothetical protein L0209_09390 [candidate division Zixibacteria bacterium]|nr:hypothetical protein [candidate division Zixibacteria bacterium]
MTIRQLSGWLFLLLLTASTVEAATPLDKIDQAQAVGRLSADQAILLKVQALKGAKTLPKEYRAGRPKRRWTACNSVWPSAGTGLEQALRPD